MSVTILDAARDYLLPVTISEIGLLLDERDEGIVKAFSGIFPVALSGFITKATNSWAHAQDLLDIVKATHSNEIN